MDKDDDKTVFHGEEGDEDQTRAAAEFKRKEAAKLRFKEEFTKYYSDEFDDGVKQARSILSRYRARPRPVEEVVADIANRT